VIAAILADRYRKQQMFQETLNQAQKVIGEDRDYELRKQLTEAQIGELGSRWGGQFGEAGPRIWTDPTSGRRFPVNPKGDIDPTSIDQPLVSPAQAADDARLKAAAALAQREAEIERAKKLYESYGYKPELLTSKTDVFKGTGPQGEYIPEGYYGTGMKGTDQYADKTVLGNIIPAKEFDEANNARTKYQEMLKQPLPEAGAQQAQSAGITREQYDALPSGAVYIAPDGSQRRKP
jgi:hypothetical protein